MDSRVEDTSASTELDKERMEAMEKQAQEAQEKAAKFKQQCVARYNLPPCISPGTSHFSLLHLVFLETCHVLHFVCFIIWGVRDFNVYTCARVPMFARFHVRACV